VYITYDSADGLWKRSTTRASRGADDSAMVIMSSISSMRASFGADVGATHFAMLVVQLTGGIIQTACFRFWRPAAVVRMAHLKASDVI